MIPRFDDAARVICIGIMFGRLTDKWRHAIRCDRCLKAVFSAVAQPATVMLRTLPAKESSLWQTSAILEPRGLRPRQAIAISRENRDSQVVQVLGASPMGTAQHRPFFETGQCNEEIITLRSVAGPRCRFLSE